MTVHRAQRPGVGVGGHISTYASSATLYEVGFNHFFRGKDHPGGGDQVYFQGHASPGIYARAFLEGRLSDRPARRLPPGALARRPGRRAALLPAPAADAGLLGVPDGLHGPRPDERDLSRPGSTATCTTAASRTPTTSTSGRSSATARWTSRSRAAWSTWRPARAWTTSRSSINCNLQRLDGPVRGNGKIIQELEAFFRGAGWNVIKVIWGREWDALLHADRDGALVNLMNTTPDGDYQTYKANDGAFVREHFFGRDPRTKELVDADERRGDLEPQARRARLPQGLRGLPGGHRAPRPADRDPREDDQGLRARAALRGSQRDPPDEEADPGRPEDVPRLAAHPDLGRGPREGPVPAAVLPPWPGRAGDPVPAGAAPPARRLRAGAAGQVQAARAARRQGLRRGAARLGQAGGRHHDGVRPAAPRPGQGQGDRPAAGADHPGRGAHVRHGLDVPDAEDLQPGTGSSTPRSTPTLMLSYKESETGPDPARGHQRGRLDARRSSPPAPRTPRTASR